MTGRSKGPEPVRIEARRLDGTTYHLTGRDAIPYCVMVDEADGLRRLLDEGHDVRKPHNEAGWTFLHPAAFQGGRMAAEVLLGHKADAKAKTAGGRTPLQLARDRGHERIAELLREHGPR